MSKVYEALLQAKQNKNTQTLHVEPEKFEMEPAFRFETEMLGLYHSLDSIFPGLERKVILFLGPKGGEGTSTVVNNLARVVTQRINRQVAILDINTLHPNQHRLFDINPVLGWSDVLIRNESVEKAIYQTDVKGLYVIPVSSSRAKNETIIDPPIMANLFESLQKRFDLTLIDCAPGMLFPDSIALSRKADGVVLVIEAESSRWPVVETLYQQIINAGGKVIGVVFNKRQQYIPEWFYKMT